MKLTFSVGGAETVEHDRNYCYSSGENILTLGASSYVNGLNLWLGGKNIPHHVLIGRFCSLSWELVFLIAYNHNYKSVSTYPKFNNPAGLNLKNSRQVIVGNDVWIGYGATIMSGVKIGNGAVIGAGAVVAKNIPPYAIAVGNPARVVKYRFDEATIKKLLAVKWWNWSLEKLADNLPIMSDVEKFLEFHYSPELDSFPEDDISRRLSMWGGLFTTLLPTFGRKVRCGLKSCAISPNRISKINCSSFGSVRTRQTMTLIAWQRQLIRSTTQKIISFSLGQTLRKFFRPSRSEKVRTLSQLAK